MSDPTPPTAGIVSEARRRELALALPPSALRDSAPATMEVRALVKGQAATVEVALARAAALMRSAAAPAVAGLCAATLEAQRAAVRLAEALHGRVLPWPAGPEALAAAAAVTQGAGLGEVYACDFVIKPGVDADSSEHPVAAAIAEHTLHSLFVPPGLEALQRLRTAAAQRGAKALTDAIMKPVTRLAVILPAGIDPVVASQWHALAAGVQEELRLSVFTLPDLEQAPTLRGILEVIGWRTGVWAGGGGVDLAYKPATRCPALDELLRRGAIDLLVQVGPLPGLSATPLAKVSRIVIGPQADALAEVCLVAPGLCPGLAARVMRCDGQVLWLCDDPAAAPADPAAGLLEALRGRMEAEHEGTARAGPAC